jgi:hypothetical protein
MHESPVVSLYPATNLLGQCDSMHVAFKMMTPKKHFVELFALDLNLIIKAFSVQVIEELLELLFFPILPRFE